MPEAPFELPTRTAPARLVEFSRLVDEKAKDLGNLILGYDPVRRALTARMRPGARGCISQHHLTDVLAIQAWLKDTLSGVPFAEMPLRYLVSASVEPGVWCLGGDLDMFSRCIRAGDVERLRRYAYDCCDVGHNMHTCMGLQILSVVLVQGKALGGGFEAARSHNIVIAEEHSTFGLPEAMFNMFPGMGAYTFLPPFIGLARTHEIVIEGTHLTAQELRALGGIEHVVPQGRGEFTLNALMDPGAKRFGAHVAATAARRAAMRVDLGEMHAITDGWVECVFKLGEQDLRTMERLVSAQDRLRQRQVRAAA